MKYFQNICRTFEQFFQDKSPGFVTVILFSAIAEGAEFEVFSEIKAFQVFKISLIFLLKKYQCLPLFSKVDKGCLYCLYLKWTSVFKAGSWTVMNVEESYLFVTEICFCMTGVIQLSLLNFSFCLKAFVNRAYLFRKK